MTTSPQPPAMKDDIEKRAEDYAYDNQSEFIKCFSLSCGGSVKESEIVKAFLAGARSQAELLAVPRERRQELVSALWKLGLDCNRVVDESSREDLIRCIIINCENRDDWRKQANQARLELMVERQRAEAAEARVKRLTEAIIRIPCLGATRWDGTCKCYRCEALAEISPDSQGADSPAAKGETI